MLPDPTIESLRAFAVDMLRRAAEAQKRGDIWSIDDDFEAFELALASTQSAQPDDFEIVRHFCDGWADSRNHDWQFYEPVAQSDWPHLARHIADDLSAQRPISNVRVLNQFSADAMSS